MTMMKMADIRPSKKNEGRDPKEPTIKLLAQSINEIGLLQPIGVRKINGTYEIVWGERRWRAHKYLKRDEIDVVVVNVNDDDADTMRLVENAQRTDIHPLDLCSIYQRAVNRYEGVAPAAKVLGKTEYEIRKMIELDALTEETTKAWRDGEIDEPTAFALVTVKDGTTQTLALKEILQQTGSLVDQKLVKSVVTESFYSLSKAPWKLSDTTLIEGRPCTTCEYRSKNDLVLFDDVTKSDVCRNVPCFRKKRALAGDRRVLELVTKEQAKHLKAATLAWFRGEEPNRGCKWFFLDGQVPAGEASKKVKVLHEYEDRQVVISRKKLKTLGTWVLQHPETGQAFWVVEKRVLFPKKKESTEPAGSEERARPKTAKEYEADRKKEDAKRAIGNAARVDLMAHIENKVPEKPQDWPIELMLLAVMNRREFHIVWPKELELALHEPKVTQGLEPLVKAAKATEFSAADLLSSFMFECLMDGVSMGMETWRPRPGPWQKHVSKVLGLDIHELFKTAEKSIVKRLREQEAAGKK